jgi:hypothetical protein
VQRTDPAPFYLFDEIDQALDPVYRTAVAKLIRNQAHRDVNRAQFILSTFREELVKNADRCFGVLFKNQVRVVRCPRAVPCMCACVRVCVCACVRVCTLTLSLTLSLSARARVQVSSIKEQSRDATLAWIRSEDHHDGPAAGAGGRSSRGAAAAAATAADDDDDGDE